MLCFLCAVSLSVVAFFISSSIVRSGSSLAWRSKSIGLEGGYLPLDRLCLPRLNALSSRGLMRDQIETRRLDSTDRSRCC